MKQLIRHFWCLAIFITGACNSTDRATTTAPESDFALPYALDAPDVVKDLPASLREISGLSLAPNGRQLVTVNDEQGVLYFLNPETGAIESKQVFGKPNDYEGIATIDSTVYVVSSKGTIYQVKSDTQTVHYPTPLNGSFDVEGLCYDAIQNRLLIACKGRAGKGDRFLHKKAIYAFDLNKMKLRDEPAYLIDRNEIARWKGGSGTLFARINEFLSTDQAPSAFGPSGLAVCPIDGNLYIVASVGKALAVVRPDGSLAWVQRLPASRFQQPEGICFDAQGRLYISSEGKNGIPGRIFRFANTKSE
ncbi:MAG: hypothetical protein H6574_03295 [Lewinellaceae bacterium]|nr:hypothetical protein [Lewinellaceae bacterium]